APRREGLVGAAEAATRRSLAGAASAAELSPGPRRYEELAAEAAPTGVAPGSFRVVVQIRRQPALGLLQVHALAPGIVGHLFLRHAPDHEVLAPWMAEVIARHRRGGQHREAVGQGHARVAVGVEQGEDLALLAVLGAGRITGRGADAAVLLGDQRLVV